RYQQADDQRRQRDCSDAEQQPSVQVHGLPPVQTGDSRLGTAYPKGPKPLRGSTMKIKRRGSAKWSGGIKDGKGAISTESGALKESPYGFASRFEGKPGTNPEELLGAAHAGCFTMALSLILGEAKLTASQMDTAAEVSLEQVEGGYAITSVHLTLRAR